MPELLPPPLVDRAFSVREALDHGVTRSRLRRSDLDAPFHGVRAKPGATSHFERCRALASVLETDQFISHSSSALLWRLPLPRPLEAEGLPIHVTSIIRRESRRSGVIGHRFPRAPPPTSLHGIPVSSPVEAWVECRDLLDVDDLIVLGDALVAKWSTFAAGSQLDLATLFDAARAAPRRGSSRLHQALELIRSDSRSPAETRLRLLLVRNGLPEPELNYDARSASGQWLGCVDIAYPAHRISIEYEGEHHFSNAAQYRKDIERRERFADAGWRTIRVTSDHMLRPRELVERVAHHLGATAPRITVR